MKKIYKSLLSEKKRNKIRNFTQRLIFPIFLGNKLYCNCCGKSFRKFLPKGNIKRLNAKCPYCFSLERMRVLDLYLENELNIYQKQNIKILHFAPEETLFVKLSSIKNIEYIDGDINPAYARYIVDITKINFPDNYFDYILCSHVLGHIPDEAKAIKEIYRVLKKNGLAILMTLIDLESKNTFEDKKIISSKDKLKYYGEFDLCRLHGLDFMDRIKKHNFKVEVIDYRKSFSEEIQSKFSLGDGKREIIYKCEKFP